MILQVCTFHIYTIWPNFCVNGQTPSELFPSTYESYLILILTFTCHRHGQLHEGATGGFIYMGKTLTRWSNPLLATEALRGHQSATSLLFCLACSGYDLHLQLAKWFVLAVLQVPNHSLECGGGEVSSWEPCCRWENVRNPIFSDLCLRYLTAFWLWAHFVRWSKSFFSSTADANCAAVGVLIVGTFWYVSHDALYLSLKWF